MFLNQGRGVGMMRFLLCVCWVCIQASADVPAFMYVSLSSIINLGVLQTGNILVNLQYTNSVKGEYLDYDKIRFLYKTWMTWLRALSMYKTTKMFVC